MSNSTPAPASRKDHLGRGILYMLLATLLFSIADAFGKLVTEDYPFMQIVWLRSMFGLVMFGAALTLTGGRFGSSKPGWHLGRSVMGIMLTTGIFMGLKHIPLAEVTAIVFATPLIVAVYSSVILKERVSTGVFVAIFTGFIGVLCVVRPTPDHFHFAHLFVLGFCCASAFMSLTARKLIHTESVLTLNFYVYPATTIVTAWWAFEDWVQPDLWGWCLFFLVSLFASLALFCLTKAMHCARPAQVAPFDYARILWTISLGYLVWGELPDSMTWLGILVIVSCGLYIVTRPGGLRPVAADAATPGT